MLGLGPHAAFILGAYSVTAVTIAALVFWTVWNARRQQRLIEELEARGVRRRSAKTTPAKKPARRAAPSRNQ